MIKEINKVNWTGEKAKIRINNAKSIVSLYGVCGEEKWEEFEIKLNVDESIITFSAHNDNWENYGIVQGWQDAKTGKWFAHNGTIERENECVFTAIAEVLYNVL